MLIDILLFSLGLVLLVKGADYFVKSASSIAKKLGVSEFVIGLTLVALGTSIPELASAIMSSIRKASGLIIGNVIGANIANIGLITGIAATIVIIKTKKEMLERDGYIMLFSMLLFFLFALDKNISRLEAIILLLIYFSYVMFLFQTKQKFKSYYGFKEFLEYFFRLKYVKSMKESLFGNKNEKKKNNKKISLSKRGLVKDFIILISGGFAIAYGVRFFIDGAIFFANLFNVPEALVGITIMSIGTTLPELSVTISAARKGLGNIALGNVIGSCITNILLIIGVASTINPLAITQISLFYAVPFMILMSIFLLIFIKTSWRIRKLEGVTLLILYILFISSLFIII
jgi:cation:H+ antiporter